MTNTSAEVWTAIIALVSPVIVLGINKLIPRIPKVILPLSTPFIGVLVGYILDLISGAKGNWINAAQAGALAVFVREVWNQAVTKRMVAPEPPVQPPVAIANTAAKAEQDLGKGV